MRETVSKTGKVVLASTAAVAPEAVGAFVAGASQAGVAAAASAVANVTPMVVGAAQASTAAFVTASTYVAPVITGVATGVTAVGVTTAATTTAAVATVGGVAYTYASNLKDKEIAELKAEDLKRQKEAEEKHEKEMQEVRIRLNASQVTAEEAKKQKERLKKLNEEKQKIIDKKNYESTYIVPERIKQHQAEHPDAFYVQVLGQRGAGKSTLINELFDRICDEEPAETGHTETTKETSFYKLKVVDNLPGRYKEIYVVDQPGIGGLEITEREYLEKFGPGHFNVTLMASDKGFNELDFALFKHLLYNNKLVMFVRTQCDNTIRSIQKARRKRGLRLNDEGASNLLKDDFEDYFNGQVLSKLSKPPNYPIEIFYTGIDSDRFEFKDYAKLIDVVLARSVSIKSLIENEAANNIDDKFCLICNAQYNSNDRIYVKLDQCGHKFCLQCARHELTISEPGYCPRNTETDPCRVTFTRQDLQSLTSSLSFTGESNSSTETPPAPCFKKDPLDSIYI